MIINVPLDLIGANPWQTRAVVDNEAVQELAADIAAHGLLQTPVGRLVKNGMRLDLVQTTEITVQFDLAKALEQAEVKVQLAFGHRRLEAFWNNLRENRSSSEIFDWTSMPVEIQVLGDQEMAAYAWSENEQRQEHTPLDRALAIQKRMEDFGWTQAVAAETLGISRPAVSNALRLLKLPEGITQALGKGEMSERQAMAVAGLFDLPESMLENAEQVFYSDAKPSVIVQRALEGASSDEIRKLVNNLALRFGKSLSQQAIWDLDLELQIGNVRSVTCKDCEWRLKERNICTDTLCFNVKERHIKQTYLEEASQASGITALDPAVGQQYLTDFQYTSEFDTILKSACENLCLTYSQEDRTIRQNKRQDSLAELGFPNAIVVCSKRSGSCSCLKGIDYAKEQERMRSTRSAPPAGGNGSEPVYEEPVEEIHAPSSEELRELARQQRAEKRELSKAVERVKEGLAQLLYRGLVDDEPGAWRLLGLKMSYHLTHANTKDKDTDELRMLICQDIVGRMLPYDPSSEAGLINDLNRQLDEMGMRRSLVLVDDGTIGYQEQEEIEAAQIPQF